MSDKQTVIDVVSKLPETATLDDIRANLQLMAKLREGLADADAGRAVPHEQVKREFRSWIIN
jgi:predicted transcriptional regulator